MSAEQMHYDLTTEPWIQAVDHEGNLSTHSLRSIFEHAHELRDLTFRSRFERLGVLRILMAITLRAFPSWEDEWEAETFDMDAINAYLDAHQDRFDLFGPTPFMQVRGLDSWGGFTIKEQGIDRIFPVRMSNGQPMHYTIASGESLTYAQAAAALPAAHMYATGGRAAGVSPGTSLTGSPTAQVTGLTAIGDSLRSTILLNSVRDPDFSDFSRDLPVWERPMPEEREERSPDGTVDMLTWASRVIELLPDEDGTVSSFRIGPGTIWKLDSTSLFGLDPQAVYRDSKNGYFMDRFTSTLIPGSAMSSLHTLIAPSASARNLVHEHLLCLPSHPERFLGYEIANYQWDSKVTRVKDSYQDGLGVPYRLIEDEDCRAHAAEVIYDAYYLKHKMSKAIIELRGLGTADASHISQVRNAERDVDHIVRQFISQGRIEEREEVMKQVARALVTNFEHATIGVDPRRWGSDSGSARGFLAAVHEHLYPKKEKTA